MYCTIRTEKIKDRQQATDAIQHNLRLRYQSNIDQSRTVMNRVLVDNLKHDPKDASSFQKKLSEKYEELKVKEKKGNVFALEFVLSASPEFFFGHVPGFNREVWDDLSMENPEDRKIIKTYWDQIDKEKLERWIKAQKEFATEEFPDVVERMDLHLDEKTPHIHLVINTTHKSIKKYKNQKGEFFKETTSLNADRFNPEYLRGMQDRYAIKNSPFGLKRGTLGSKRKHKKLKDFYEEKAAKTIDLVEKAEKFDRIEDIFPIVKKALTDSYNQLLQLLDIIVKKELTKEEKEIISAIADSVPDLQKKKANKIKTTQ